MEFDNDHSFINQSAEEELHVLQSIYSENELKVERTTEILRLTFKINPDLVSGETVSRRYISLQLEIELDKNYPTRSPNVKIRNPRGLNDEDIKALEAQISTFMTENIDLPVLYDIIQMTQDFSIKEVPSLPCSICLCKFTAEDSIFVTGECHHHFHAYCLGRYVEHCLNEKCEERDRLPEIEKNTIDDVIYCPICRCPIECPEIDKLLSSSPPNNDETNNGPGSSDDLSHLSDPIDRQYRDLYEKQKAQGGLIDHEKERQKMLLTDDDIFVAQPASQLATSSKECDSPEQGASSNNEPLTREEKYRKKDYYRYKLNSAFKRFEPILNSDCDKSVKQERKKSARKGAKRDPSPAGGLEHIYGSDYYSCGYTWKGCPHALRSKVFSSNFL